MEYLHSTIDRELQRLISEKQEEKSFFYKEKGYSWKELNEVAEKMTMDILHAGISWGSRIAIWSQNSPLYVCALFAICKAGCTAVLMNPGYTTWEVNQMVAYAELSGIYCDDQCIKKLQFTKNIRMVNYIGLDAWERLVNREAPAEEEKQRIREREAQTDPQDFACMLFTSGTTGQPKGVELTHFQLLNVALRAVHAMHWNEKDKVCFSLPMFHSFGLSTGLLAALFHRGQIYLNTGYHSVQIMECVERYGCTVLNGVPTMFLSILYNPERPNYNLSSLNSGIIAGSGVHETDFLTIARELSIPHLMQSYGQTEASPSITFSPYEDSLEKRARSVGVAIPEVEIRIRQEGCDANAPSGEKGEVEIRGFNTMKGYFHMNAESGKVLRKDGWMKTGDIGYMDDDGYLYICGRSKEMIIRGGENISPQEIEEVLLHMDGVKQVKVLGIKEEVIQEAIAACIIQTKEHTKEEIQNFVKNYLAGYKVPEYVFFFRDFPENSSGKIDINKLKTMVEELRRTPEQA